MPAHGRFTLLPHGLDLSTNESREQCIRLLGYCDADPARFHDRKFSDSERFIQYIKRFPALLVKDTPKLVAFTQTCPLLRTVIHLRQSIVEKVPSMATALWVIFVDPETDPSFERMANSRLGRLDAEINRVPVFTDVDGWPYLVLTPATDDYEYVRLRARLLSVRCDHLAASHQNDTARSVRGNRLPLTKP